MTAETLNHNQHIVENPDTHKQEETIKNLDEERNQEEITKGEQADRELTPEELKKWGKKWLEAERMKAPELARNYAKDLVDLETFFYDRLIKLEKSGVKMSKEEFEKWEDDFSFNWQHMYAELAKIGVIENIGAQESSIKEAETQRLLMLVEQNLLVLPKDSREEKSYTIEANAGHFYSSPDRDNPGRSESLLNAIEASEAESAEKEKDKKIVKSLFEKAAEHLAYKYLIENPKKLDDEGYRRYERNRTNAHNEMIRTLNRINDLARKYGTRPLTPRNFWTSDRPQPTDDIKNRMRADRDIVEAYVDIAFSDEVDKSQKDQERGIY